MLARRHTPLHAIAWTLLMLAAPVRAAAPPVFYNPDYGLPLPGDYVSPANAASAALALSDRWLGATGFENPAGTQPRGIQISPVFQRVSRQDLSSQNRDFEQISGYPDVLGARLSWPVQQWGFTLYAWQPLLRLEEVSFSAGPLAQPAFVRIVDSQREIRAGAAISRGAGAARIGVSGEYVRRDDSYETQEVSGSPLAGNRTIDMSADGYGATVGFTWDKDTDRPWGSWFGAAIRYGSEQPFTGEYAGVNDIPGGVATDTTYAFETTRETEWSGGVSGRVSIAPATWFVAGLSMRTGSDWTGFGFGTGTGASWSVGIDWKDPELPWGARFGVGQEKNEGAMEAKAGLIGVGFTWVSGDLVLDVGLLHRNLAREDFPRSSDDRIVGSVKIGL